MVYYCADDTVYYLIHTVKYPMKSLDSSIPSHMGIHWNSDLAMVELPSPTLGPWGYVLFRDIRDIRDITYVGIFMILWMFLYFY
jgi:hypothetical protein